MRLRRARLTRLVYRLINVLAALTSIGVGAVLLLMHEPKTAPPAPRPVFLPLGEPEGFADMPPAPLRAAKPIPAPVRPSAYEDLQILIDAPADFEQRYRVIFALLEREPAERRCIIEQRGGSEQLVLSPNDRMGTWLLLAIEPEPTSPRSVRLRFRDLRRGEDIVTVLAPDL